MINSRRFGSLLQSSCHIGTLLGQEAKELQVLVTESGFNGCMNLPFDRHGLSLELDNRNGYT